MNRTISKDEREHLLNYLKSYINRKEDIISFLEEKDCLLENSLYKYENANLKEYVEAAKESLDINNVAINSTIEDSIVANIAMQMINQTEKIKLNIPNFKSNESKK